MAERVHRGQPMPGCQCDNQIAMSLLQSARCNDQPAVRTARESLDTRLDLVRVAHDKRSQLHAERRRHPLECGQLTDSDGCEGIAKDSGPGYAGGNLLEQFQPFHAHAVFESGKAGGVATRPRQTCDQSGTDRIDEPREHDRHIAVACCSATTIGVVLAKMTSGASVISPIVSLRMLSASPAPQRVSIRTLRPTAQPRSCNP